MQERYARYGDGAWWKTAFAVVPDSRLYAENVFECLAAVPHTTFVARRAAAYAPGEVAAVLRGCVQMTSAEFAGFWTTFPMHALSVAVLSLRNLLSFSYPLPPMQMLYMGMPP